MLESGGVPPVCLRQVHACASCPAHPQSTPAALHYTHASPQHTRDATAKQCCGGAGDYVIQVALRHDAVNVLEELRQLVLAVERKVDSAITVPCHSKLQTAVTGGKAMSGSTLRLGERCALPTAPPPAYLAGQLLGYSSQTWRSAAVWQR